MIEELIIGTDFSGLGSVEEAIKRLQVKHKIAFACDSDKYVKASYLANHYCENFYDDITTRSQALTPNSDMYVFGFPCQAFSMSGNRLGFEDTRGTLYRNSLEYIDKKRPRVFVGENVKGLLSHDKVKGSKSKYGRTFGVVRDSLGATVNGQHNLYKYDDCLNYHLHFFVMNTKEFGIPQNRERIFLIGFRDESDSIKFKKPKPFPRVLTLKDLLEDVVDEKYYLSDQQISVLLKQLKNPEAIEDSDNKLLRWANSTDKMVFDEVSNTLKSNTKTGYMNLQYKFEKTNTEPAIFSLRGRHLVNGKRIDIPGEPTEQVAAFNTDGIANTITSVQKDNLLVLFEGEHSTNRVYSTEGIARTIKASDGGGGSKTGLYLVDNTAKGYTEANLFDSIDVSHKRSKTKRGRVGKQIANTLDTTANQAVLLPGFRIRRLTPRECFRLMGYTDAFFEKCALVNSDSQLYKQAGNSIVVDTIMHLLIQIFKAINIPYVYE